MMFDFIQVFFERNFFIQVFLPILGLNVVEEMERDCHVMISLGLKLFQILHQFLPNQTNQNYFSSIPLITFTVIFLTLLS